MKKIRNLFLCAAFSTAMTFCVSCGSQGQEDYIKSVESELNAMNEFVANLQLDSLLSQDQMMQKVNEKWEKVSEKLSDIAKRGLEKHKNDTVAVRMIELMAELELETKEEIAKAIDKLGPDAKTNPVIMTINEYCTAEEKAPEGAQFVDFAITQPDGKVMKLSDFAGNGQYCLVDFWASWCGPCKREIPNLKAVYEEFAPKDLVVVSVAVWDKPENSVATAQELGICWNHIIDAGETPTNLYGIDGIPHIILIGPDGTILKRGLRGSQIRATIAQYL